MTVLTLEATNEINDGVIGDSTADNDSAEIKINNGVYLMMVIFGND